MGREGYKTGGGGGTSTKRFADWMGGGGVLAVLKGVHRKSSQIVLTWGTYVMAILKMGRK